jgi:methionyl-tRNA synthetase
MGVEDDGIALKLSWGILKPGTKIGRGEALFPRLKNELTSAPVTNAPAPAAETKMTIDEFAKMELKTARVLQAERVDGAEKLLKLQIDLGNEQRQIVAGIAQYYKPDDMVGKTIVVITNLDPARIRGVESNGMLLAAQSGGKLVLLTTDNEISPGSKVS